MHAYYIQVKAFINTRAKIIHIFQEHIRLSIINKFTQDMYNTPAKVYSLAKELKLYSHYTKLNTHT